jgi:branched-chain amino acid transport system ATP-binding protein
MLEIENLTAGYGRTTVLRDVSLRVESGTVVALLGANGAGKTTLLRAVSRALPIPHGSVRFNGDDVSRLTPDRVARRGVCHIPEGRGIFPSLTVKENVAMFAGRRGGRAAIDQFATEFPALQSRLGQIAGSLSGGEQQMLAMSRAFFGEPHLVLVDEVSLGLAPRIVDDLFEFLRRLAGTGVSLLLVEQYIERALDLADYAYVLDRGHVAQKGPAGALDVEQITEAYVGSSLK